MGNYVIYYNYSCGSDAWLYQCNGEPDLESIGASLTSFRPDDGEWLEWHAVGGDWKIAGPVTGETDLERAVNKVEYDHDNAEF